MHLNNTSRFYSVQTYANNLGVTVSKDQERTLEERATLKSQQNCCKVDRTREYRNGKQIKVLAFRSDILKETFDDNNAIAQSNSNENSKPINESSKIYEIKNRVYAIVKSSSVKLIKRAAKCFNLDMRFKRNWLKVLAILGGATVKEEATEYRAENSPNQDKPYTIKLELKRISDGAIALGEMVCEAGSTLYDEYIRKAVEAKGYQLISKWLLTT